MIARTTSSNAQPTGPYVVVRPAKTDAIGSILRASFGLHHDPVKHDFAGLLAAIDRPARLS